MCGIVNSACQCLSFKWVASIMHLLFCSTLRLMLWAQLLALCIDYDKSVFVWFGVLNFVQPWHVKKWRSSLTWQSNSRIVLCLLGFILISVLNFLLSNVMHILEHAVQKDLWTAWYEFVILSDLMWPYIVQTKIQFFMFCWPCSISVQSL